MEVKASEIVTAGKHVPRSALIRKRQVMVQGIRCVSPAVASSIGTATVGNIPVAKSIAIETCGIV